MLRRMAEVPACVRPWLVLVLVMAARRTFVSSMPTPSQRPGQGLHTAMTEEHLQFFFGRSEPDDGDFQYHTVNPSEVTADGRHITFDLLEPGHRRRRSSRSAEPVRGKSEHSHFRVHAFDREYIMQVSEIEPMFTDHSRVELYDASGNVSQHRPMMEPTHCHYRGHLPDVNSSLVAFSTCKGMSGAVLSPVDTFYVHPLPGYLHGHPANNRNHTHIVYRRSTELADYGHSSTDEKLESCGVGERPSPDYTKSSTNDYIPLQAAVDGVYAKYNPQRRTVQTQYGPFYIEMALVVDPYMWRAHGRNVQSLMTYVLTLMNLMQTVMNPAGMGFEVTLHVTRIVILTEHLSSLPISHDSTALLDHFCEFQQSINTPLDSHPLHHDFAMLLTGIDLCAGDNRKGCGELGRAYIASLCRSKSSCSVVRDKGIQNAVVMSHELGHVLGAYHDQRICPFSGGYVMEASTTRTKQFWEFSDCSKAYFREYLGSNKAECALDCPRYFHGLAYNGKSLPGDTYSLAQQCHFLFPNYTFCSRTPYGRDDLCKSLYCDSGDQNLGCWTTYQPALDGSPCRGGRICYRRKCVDPQEVSRARPGNLTACQRLPSTADLTDEQRHVEKHMITSGSIVNGGWNKFSAWSRCSLTCGDGRSYRSRECKSPEPANGGKDCEGLDREIRSCRLPPCVKDTAGATSLLSAAELCAELSTRTTGHLLPFVSLNTTHMACKLLCFKADDSKYKPLDMGADLPNGAPCSQMVEGGMIGGQCVDGTCIHNIGCDGVLGSGVVKDECGYCGGKGQCCRKSSTTTRRTLRRQPGSYSLLSLPRNAKDIVLRQRSHHDRIHLALRSSRTKILNGKTGTPPGYVQMSIPPDNKAVLTYTRPSNSPDLLTIKGTLRETLQVHSFVPDGPGNNIDPGVTVTYTIVLPGCSVDYFWLQQKTPCSETCGTGVQTEYTVCARRGNGAPVNARLCNRLGGYNRNRTLACKTPIACETERHEWRYYGWSGCSKTCGSGQQTRNVRCFRVGVRRPVRDSECKDIKFKPIALRLCNLNACPDKPMRWINKKWSPCSVTCGRGAQVRAVICRQFVDGVPFNLPPYVCKRAGLTQPLAHVRACDAKAKCQSKNRPRPCNDITSLCKVVKAGRSCSKMGMRDLCCESCWA